MVARSRGDAGPRWRGAEMTRGRGDVESRWRGAVVSVVRISTGPIRMNTTKEQKKYSVDPMLCVAATGDELDNPSECD